MLSCVGQACLAGATCVVAACAAAAAAAAAADGAAAAAAATHAGAAYVRDIIIGTFAPGGIACAFLAWLLGCLWDPKP